MTDGYPGAGKNDEFTIEHKEGDWFDMHKLERISLYSALNSHGGLELDLGCAVRFAHDHKRERDR